MKWHKNTNMLVSKGFQRMIILQKLSQFDVSREDLVNIYKLYIRSILEQSCQVWHTSLSQDDTYSIERVQKVACKLILKDDYLDYASALETLSLDTLHSRRQNLCLKFAKKCVTHPKASSMFPLNQAKYQSTRNHEKYHVQKAKTSRLKYSAIPQMQRLLNKDVIQRKHKN